eukprot:342635-Chlamydomonas_euryale.AAC.2
MLVRRPWQRWALTLLALRAVCAAMGVATLLCCPILAAGPAFGNSTSVGCSGDMSGCLASEVDFTFADALREVAATLAPLQTLCEAQQMHAMLAAVQLAEDHAAAATSAGGWWPQRMRDRDCCCGQVGGVCRTSGGGAGGTC